MVEHSISLVNNAKNEMGEHTKNLVATIEETGNIAMEKANTAISAATTIANNMKEAATVLNTDVKNLKTASDGMLTTLTTEIGTIKNQFITFGQSIKQAALGIVEKTVEIRNEFTEAVNQVNAPMLMVKEYARRAKEDNIIFLPINVVGMIYWAFLKGVI